MKWMLLHVKAEETFRISSDFNIFQINIMGQLIRDWVSKYRELENVVSAFKYWYFQIFLRWVFLKKNKKIERKKYEYIMPIFYVNVIIV